MGPRTAAINERARRLFVGAVAVVASLLASCSTKPAVSDAGLTKDAGALHTVDAGPVFVSASRRCAECHTKIADDWRESPHASTDSVPLYLAMKASSKSATCDGCHAPLRGRIPKGHEAEAEGVTCDVCHTMTAVGDARFGAEFTMRLDDNVKYGPYCDAKAPYFHKIACSTLHEDSRQCASCHVFRLPSGPGKAEIPVITDYEDWKASNAGTTGISCQSCHMPGARAEIAVGAGTRAAVGAHLFRPAQSTTTTGGGVEWKIAARLDGANIRVDVELKNAVAGHALPSGLAGRRIVLRVTTRSPGGTPVPVQQREYARILVDGAGTEVPFYEAVKVQSDTRIEADRSRLETFFVPAKPKAVIALDLVRMAISPAVAVRVGAPPPVEIQLRRAQIDLPDDIRKVKGALRVAPTGP